MFAHISGGILSHSSLQILSKSLRFRGWRLATRTFSSLHRFSMGWRSGDCLGHSRTLMYCFLTHSFVALAVCFGSLSCWNTLPRSISMPWRYMAPSIVPLMWCSCCVSTSMFDGGDGVLGVIGSIPPLPNTASWVDAKELDFGLIWPQHFPPVLLWIIGTLQTGCTCAFLSRGTLWALPEFSP